MLSSLSIRDFVIVESLDLNFESGLTVLSGETGAGKSILIDALSLCLGARADAGQIREGCDKTTITAVFASNPSAEILLKDQAIDVEDEIHLRRVVDVSGKSKAFINGVAVPATTLRELSSQLIEIHGQHAFQLLGKPNEQLKLLDAFGELDADRELVAQAYHSMKSAETTLQKAQAEQVQIKTRIENLQWKLDILQRISPVDGQWEELNLQHDRLSHGAELIEGTQSSVQTLVENDQSLLDQLSTLIERLTRLATRDPALNSIVQSLTEGEILLREAGHELNHYVRHADLDPEMLEQAQQRLSDWHDAARKLKIPPEELPREFVAIQEELSGLTAHMDLDTLSKQAQTTANEFMKLAKGLSIKRQATAKILAAKVSDSMQTLAMQGGVFEIHLEPAQASRSGCDAVEFRVAGHPGVTPQPLGKVASGGELARISLAITVNTVASTHVPSLIFDEVDSGIGGAVAETVGRYLRQLAGDKQILCVTHLPQVAAQGHNHLQVSKETEAGRTRSSIKPLGEDSRVQEIARMLGGITISEATRTAARELIAGATAR